MTTKRNTTHTRIFKEDAMKINQWKLKLSGFEGKPLGTAEVIRRLTKIVDLTPIIKETLIQDALLKKQRRIKI